MPANEKITDPTQSNDGFQFLYGSQTSHGFHKNYGSQPAGGLHLSVGSYLTRLKNERSTSHKYDTILQSGCQGVKYAS